MYINVTEAFPRLEHSATSLPGREGPTPRRFRCEESTLHRRVTIPTPVSMTQQRVAIVLESSNLDPIIATVTPLSSEPPVQSIDGFFVIPNVTIPTADTVQWMAVNYTGGPYYVTTGKEIMYICLYCIFLLLALLGNSVVIVTLLRNPRMRTVTNCFLLSLSASDLMLASVCMPITLTGRILQEFIFGPVMCKVFTYFMGVSVAVSTYTMLAISIERYYAICNPFRSRGWQTKSHAHRVICIIWITSFIMMLPYPVSSMLRYFPIPGRGKCTQGCRLVMTKFLTKSWYTVLIVALFIIPGVIMTVSYIKVCLKIYKGFRVDGATSGNRSAQGRISKDSSANRTGEFPSSLNQSMLMPPGDELRIRRSHDSRMTQSTSQLQAKRRVVLMLILIVILFFVFWTPLFSVNLWRAFDERGAIRSLEGSIEIIQLMSYVSTSVNPIIYCFMNKKFRDGFVRAFLCCIPGYCRLRFASQPTMATTHYHSENTQMALLSTPKTQRSLASTV